MTDLRLAYGLNTDTIPEDARAVWGARLIWPSDLVWDRTSWDMVAEPDRQALQDWLNAGRLKITLDDLRARAAACEITPRDSTEFVVFEDETGKIVANCKGSHGYVYVAAWLKA